MDKKELNDLIDRVVLTGPGGVDKIKKILKELVSKSDGSDSDDSSDCKCLAPMLVEGTINMIDGDMIFTPNAGMPSCADAKAYMIGGGQVYMIVDTGVETTVNVAISAATDYIAGWDYLWPNSGSEGGDEGGDEPEPS